MHGIASRNILLKFFRNGDGLMKDRIKNPYFWIGLVGVILTALQVEASTLTSWDKVLQLIIDTIQNPYLLTTTVMAVIGVVVDPTTRGAKDRKVVK